MVAIHSIRLHSQFRRNSKLLCGLFMTLSIPAGSSEKICFGVEVNVMHTFEDRIIEMTASHDRFSVANVDGRHNVMGDLLSVKYGFLM